MKPTPPRSNAALNTAKKLDEMDDNLRRLGLGGEQGPALSGRQDRQHGPSNEEYISKIRSAKNEKIRQHLEKEYRQAVAAEQHQTAERASNMAASTRTPQEILTEGEAILAQGVTVADAFQHRLDNKELDQQVRLERTTKAAAGYQQTAAVKTTQRRDSDSYLFSLDTSGHQINVISSPSTLVDTNLNLNSYTQRREEKHLQTVQWCEKVARGLVELALCVSDNRFLPAVDLTGRPVRRLRQDLKVTQWRTWVDTLVFPSPEVVEEPPPGDGDGAAGEATENIDGNTASQGVSKKDPQDGSDAGQLADQCLYYASQAAADSNAAAQVETVSSVMATLQAEVERQRKVALEDLRRIYDEEQSTSLPASPPSAAAKEEVVPGWTQRMPPAACFVYGDALSGARLLSDTVDLYVSQRRLVQGSQHASTATSDAGAPLQGSSSAPFHDGVSSHVVMSAVGVAMMDEPQCNVVKSFITPRSLLWSGTGGRYGGCAPRQRNPHNTTGGPSNAGGGGGGGGGGRSGRRGSTVEDDERKETEQLVEALVKEIVAVHRHNLCVLAGWTLAAAAPVPPGPSSRQSGEGSMPNRSLSTPVPPQPPGLLEIIPPGANPEDPAPLHCLFLLGFPDSSMFIQLLSQRLRRMVETTELDLLTAESQRILAEQQLADTDMDKAHQRISVNVRKGTSPKTKGSRHTKSANGAEELAAAAMLAELQAKKVFPPLAVLNVFLTYSLPTRQRRLAKAALVSGPGAEMEGGGTFYHHILNPQLSGGYVSVSKEPLASRASSFRRNNSTSSCNLISIAAAHSLSAAYVDTWDSLRLRKELKRQDEQQRRGEERWASVLENQFLSEASRPSMPALVSSSPLTKHQSKRREKTGNDGERSVASRRISVSPSSIGVEDMTTNSDAAQKSENTTATSFPRALFFSLIEDISDGMNVNEGAPLADEEMSRWGSLARTVWQNSDSGAAVQWELDLSARIQCVHELLERLNIITTPAVKRVLTNESLIPHQVVEPLRLGDYRLPATICQRLVQTYKSYQAALPSDTIKKEDLQQAIEEEHWNEATAISPSLLSEVSLWHVSTAYSERWLALLSSEAFSSVSTHPLPAHRINVDSREGTVTSLPTLDSTAYFGLVDRSYVSAKEKMVQYSTLLEGHIANRMALFLRCTIDTCIDQVAACLDLLAKTMERHSESMPSGEVVVKSPTSMPTAPSQGFLQLIQRLNAKEAVELVALLGGGKKSDKIDEWNRIRCLEGFFAQLSSQYVNAIGEAAVASMLQWLSGQRITNLATSAAASASLEEAGGAALRTAELPVSEYVPKIVEMILSKCFMSTVSTSQLVAPSLARAAIVIREIHLRMRMLHFGGNAWLETLYRATLQLSPGSLLPREMRPSTLSQIANGNVVEDDERTSNRWVFTETEVFLSSYSVYNRADMDKGAFVHCFILCQMQYIQGFLTDHCGNKLAAQVDYPTLPSIARQQCSPSLKTIDASFSAYLINDAPCRQSHAPFFTVADMRALFAATVKHQSAAMAIDPEEMAITAAPLRVNTQEWILSVLLRRICYCCESRCCAAVQRGLSVVSPTTRDLRHIIMTLPSDLLEQELQAPPRAAVTTGSVEESLPHLQWGDVQWWWGSSASPMCPPFHFCWVLPRILACLFRISTAGVEGGPSPSLSRVLRFMVHSTGIGDQLESRLISVFHCIAALQHIRSGKGSDEDDTDTALYVSKDMSFSVEEFVLVMRLLFQRQMMTEDNRGGAEDGEVLASINQLRPCDGFELDVDTQLLLQVEEANAVKLSLLLSSRWARLLLEDHGVNGPSK